MAFCNMECGCGRSCARQDDHGGHHDCGRSHRRSCPECSHPLHEHYAEPGHGFRCWERMSYENNDFCGCTHGAPPKASLLLYVVRNGKGEFFRASSSRRVRRSAWAQDVVDAKFYVRASMARARIRLLRGSPSQELPLELVELNAVERRVVADHERVQDAKRRDELADVDRKRSLAEAQVARAKQQLVRAQDRLRGMQEG